MFSKVKKFFPYYEKAKQAEEKAEKANEELFLLRKERERLTNDASIGSLVKGIAHDFRNLITMLGEQDLIRIFLRKTESIITPDQKKKLEVSLRMLYGVCDTNDEILTLCRIWAQSIMDTACVTKGKKLHPLLSLVESVILICKGELANKGINVKINVEENVPLILCNKGDIIRMLLNLVINAMQSMENVENRAIFFSLRHNDGEVFLDMTDTGKNIPTEILGRIFEKNFTTKEGGLGFGLCIVQQIVNDHGGKISVRNLPQGKVFSLVFPSLS